MTDGADTIIRGNQTGGEALWGAPSYSGIQKRLLDLICGAILAIIALPLVLYAALYIKCVSKGSALFKQERIGHEGKKFLVLKLRTMYENAQGSLDQISRDDVRIIPGGRFLRKTRIDEVPQLWNVLRGEMSLVGPRPRPEEVDHKWCQADPKYLERRRVKPGITGPAQLTGRSDTPEEMRRAGALERNYIQNWSLWRDLKILLVTGLVILQAKGV